MEYDENELCVRKLSSHWVEYINEKGWQTESEFLYTYYENNALASMRKRDWNSLKNCWGEVSATQSYGKIDKPLLTDNNK